MILGSLPIIGDLVDIYDAAKDEENMDWASGQYCTNSDENTRWGTYKYYQRYIQDQRILEQLGAYEDSKNPVIGYLEEYEAENPSTILLPAILLVFLDLAKMTRNLFSTSPTITISSTTTTPVPASPWTVILLIP